MTEDLIIYDLTSIVSISKHLHGDLIYAKSWS